MLFLCSASCGATAIARGFWEAAMSSSSSGQQVQLPCAGCNSFLDHKSSSSSTTWRKGRSTGRSLCYVSVCTHGCTIPINNFCSTPHFFQERTGGGNKGGTQQRSRQLQAFLCCPSLSIYWLLFLVLVFRLPKNLDLCCDTYSDTFRRLATIYTRCNNSSRLLCDKSTWFDWKFFCSSWRWERETVAGVLFFTMVGSKIREGNWPSILSESLHINGTIALVGLNLAALSFGCYPAMLCTLADMFFRSLYWWASSSRQRKVRKCSMLWKNSLDYREGQCSFLFSCDSLYAWDVENA